MNNLLFGQTVEWSHNPNTDYEAKYRGIVGEKVASELYQVVQVKVLRPGKTRWTKSSDTVRNARELIVC